jgi:hypothetical protein
MSMVSGAATSGGEQPLALLRAGLASIGQLWVRTAG